MLHYSSFILMLSVAYARRSPVAGPETSRRAHRGIGGVTLCSRARLREGVCFDEDAASRDGGRRDGVATSTRARATRRAAARIDALVSDALFLADFLKSHIAPEVAEESLDHLRATINAQKRRLRRCRSGGTVDETSSSRRRSATTRPRSAAPARSGRGGPGGTAARTPAAERCEDPRLQMHPRVRPKTLCFLASR